MPNKTGGLKILAFQLICTRIWDNKDPFALASDSAADCSQPLPFFRYRILSISAEKQLYYISSADYSKPGSTSKVCCGQSYKALYDRNLWL